MAQDRGGGAGLDWKGMADIQQALWQWCEDRFEEQFALLKTLAAIPAPSHHEEL